MRKFWFLFLLAGCSPPEPQKEICSTFCLREAMRDVQVCSNNTGNMLAGAAAGYFLGGHFFGKSGERLGTMVGAAAGASGDTRCRMEREKYCEEYKRECKANPEWEEWSKRK